MRRAADAALPTDQREPRGAGAATLTALARAQGSTCPSPVCSAHVFADSGYDAATQFESLGDRKLANLWKLLDLARTFDRSGPVRPGRVHRPAGDFVRISRARNRRPRSRKTRTWFD